MNIALRKPRMTREEFFAWAQARDTRYEFDGYEPVAMTGGTANHSQITQNILVALRSRLHGGDCRPLGPDAGVATVGDTVRYPDALVTCAKIRGDAQIIPGVVVVFEVLSPTSGRTDSRRGRGGPCRCRAGSAAARLRRPPNQVDAGRVSRSGSAASSDSFRGCRGRVREDGARERRGRARRRATRVRSHRQSARIARGCRENRGG